MSTRRARIKAVPSVPVRCKNKADTKSNPTTEPQDDVGLKSDGPIETSTKVHMELTSSSEYEKMSVKTSSMNNGKELEITASKEIEEVSVKTSSLNNGKELEITASKEIEEVSVKTSSLTNGKELDITVSKEINAPEQSKTNNPEKKSNSSILATVLTCPPNKNFASKVPITVDHSSLLEPNTNGDSKSGVKILSNIPFNLKWYSANVNQKTENVVAKCRDNTGGVEGIVPLEEAHSGAVDLLKNDILSSTANIQFDPILPLPLLDKSHGLRPLSRREPSLCRYTIKDCIRDLEDELKGMATAVQTGQAREHMGGDSESSPSTHQAQPIAREKENEERVSKKMEKVKGEQRMEEGAGVGLEGEERAEEESEDWLEDQDEEMPAPQIKLGPDGQVVIDESSLVIKKRKRRRGVLSANVFLESEGGGGWYKHRPRGKGWSGEETERFYRALTAVGTDFSMMTQLFPERSRKDLKIKFKKEEKINGAQIDKALANHVKFDVDSMKETFERECVEEREQMQNLKDTLRAQREKIELARSQGLHYGMAAKSMLEMMPTQRPSLKVGSAKDILLFNSLHQYSEEKGTETDSKPAQAPAPPQRPRLMKYSSSSRTFSLPADVDPMTVVKDVPPGSIICVSIPNPEDTSKMFFQTYVSDDKGGLSSIDLPPAIVRYAKEFMSSENPTNSTLQNVSADSNGVQPNPGGNILYAIIKL